MHGPVDKKTDQPSVTLWKATDLDAELLHGRFRRFSYAPHVHGTACLALITRGQIRIRMRGSEFTAGAGDLYAIDADEVHAGWSVDSAGWNQRTMYLDMGQLQSLTGRYGHGLAKLRGPVIRDANLAKIFLGIHHCSQADGAPLKRQSHFIDFAERLLSDHVTQETPASDLMREPKAVRLAMSYLDAESANRVSLADVSRAANLPPFRILRAFERCTGLTPHAYQRLRRLQSAQALVRNGTNLAVAAAAAGFSDQAHLTRAFKAAFGVSPGVYRRALQ